MTYKPHFENLYRFMYRLYFEAMMTRSDANIQAVNINKANVCFELFRILKEEGILPKFIQNLLMEDLKEAIQSVNSDLPILFGLTEKQKTLKLLAGNLISTCINGRI